MVLALGGAVTYMIYVMWSSFAEILECLEGKALGGIVRMQEAERRETGQETDAAEVQAGFICPRCGKVQQEGTTFCRDRKSVV